MRNGKFTSFFLKILLVNKKQKMSNSGRKWELGENALEKCYCCYTFFQAVAEWPIHSNGCPNALGRMLIHILFYFPLLFPLVLHQTAHQLVSQSVSQSVCRKIIWTYFYVEKMRNAESYKNFLFFTFSFSSVASPHKSGTTTLSSGVYYYSIWLIGWMPASQPPFLFFLLDSGWILHTTN